MAIEEKEKDIKEEDIKEKAESTKVEKAKVQEAIKETKPFNKNLLWIILPVVLVLLGFLFVSNYSKYSDLTAEEILKEMDVPLAFGGYIVSTEVDHIIPSVSKVMFKDARIDEEDSDEEYIAGSISVFENSEKARLYKDRVDNKLKKVREEITLEEYGYMTSTVKYNEYVVANKNAVLRLNNNFSESEKIAYKTIFDNVVNKCKYTQVNIPTNEEIQKIMADSKKDIEESVENYKSLAGIFVEETAELLDTAINELKTTLKTDTLEDVRETITEIYHGNLFTKQREKWDKELKEIEKLIEKKKKEDEAKAKDADIKKRTKTLSTGTYVVGEDISPGKYDCIAKSGNGNFFVWGSDGYSLKVNEVFGVGTSYYSDFYTKNFNGLTLETGDKIELKGGLSVLFQAK